ncbi:MAG: hypothetical protein RI885_596 [Actinomycetota bacterium]|jgi:Lon protease-like protein
MTELPMFPLGSVLFPYMPLQLRVFEERYLVMLAAILDSEGPEFGVTLIERGQEVGGGEHRFAIGTVAQVTELEAREEFIALAAQGERRITVEQWLEEDPYPHATVTVLDELVWDADLEPLRQEAEKTVRRTLAVASEFSEQLWAAVVQLSDDPMESSWQLAGIAPVGQLDQLKMLRAETTEQLLRTIIEVSNDAEEGFRLTWNE